MTVVANEVDFTLVVLVLVPGDSHCFSVQFPMFARR